MVDVNKPKTQLKSQAPWSWTSIDTSYGTVTTASESYEFISTDDLLTSSGHYGYWNPEKRGDTGGPFEVVKRNYEGTAYETYTFNAGAGVKYSGPQVAYAIRAQGNDSFPNANWRKKSRNQLLIEGSDAISKLIPTSPRVNLATMLGELVTEGGLPHPQTLLDMKDRCFSAKKAGSSYLEYQFGWAPLVRDVTALVHVLQDHKTIIDAYIKNAGKRLHRSYKWDLEMEDREELYTPNAKPAPNYSITIGHQTGDASSNNRTTTLALKRKQWLECAFTYSIPPAIDNLSKLLRQEQITNYLYGTRITPETLWNLAPWSWAIDWFSNLGSVFKNVSELNSNGLVLEYAYIMETIEESRKYVLNTNYKAPCDPQCSHPAGPADYWQQFTTVRKRRYPVGPFNVGWNFGSLSADQLRIAVALGFSRR